jgi:RNA polymerase sigma factor (sigma-70 family)
MYLQHAHPHSYVETVRPAIERSSVAELVEAARAGDERAWAELVRRFEPMMRRVARRWLSPAQADDVVQVAWLRFFKHIGDLRAAAAVGAWLRITVRREAFRALQGHVGELLLSEPLVDDVADQGEEPETQVLGKERHEVLARAIARLPERHRRLMDVLLTEPGLAYPQISARTGIPMGSIGPIRGRCLIRMADVAEVQALRD